MDTPRPPTTNTLAIVSLVFGVAAWVLLPLVGAVVAIITGHMARGELRRSQPAGHETGDGLAIAGLVLGWLQLALIVMGFFAVLFIFGSIAALAAIFG